MSRLFASLAAATAVGLFNHASAALAGNGMAVASNVMRVWQMVRVKKGVPVWISVKHRAYLEYFD